MADKSVHFSKALVHASRTGEHRVVQGARRRAAIASSKISRLKPSQIRAQRLKAAVNQARHQQAIKARNNRFKLRLSRVKAAAKKGARNARRGGKAGSSDNR